MDDSSTPEPPAEAPPPESDPALTLPDGAGYDIRSFNPDGSDRLIEVKTTNGAALTPFYLSENERAFSEERPEAFRLLRLHDFREKPAGFELVPPLDNWVSLLPTAYRASF